MDENDMMHGVDWAGEDLSGWYASEKMKGARAYWDGANLYSKSGRLCQIPEEFRRALPEMALDMELYDGIDGESRCGVAIKRGKWLPSMRLIIFDAPGIDADWPERISQAIAATEKSRHLLIPVPASWPPCRSTAETLEHLAWVKANGGEGLMMRRPGLKYTPGRSYGMLKLKSISPIGR